MNHFQVKIFPKKPQLHLKNFREKIYQKKTITLRKIYKKKQLRQEKSIKKRHFYASQIVQS